MFAIFVVRSINKLVGNLAVTVAIGATVRSIVTITSRKQQEKQKYDEYEQRDIPHTEQW